MVKEKENWLDSCRGDGNSRNDDRVRVVEGQSMPLLEDICQQIEATFEDYPHRFLTEHDLHSELALITARLLTDIGNLFAKTRDGHIISRVHHEYPTPFRCLMRGSQFRVVNKAEFREERMKNPRFRARRGSFDFVVFNREYVSANKLHIVSGKNHRNLLQSLKDEQNTVLDLAIEVVYFPSFDGKPRIGMMKRAVDSVIQDYKKLVALMEFTYSGGTPFCTEAAMMFFSNTPHKGALEGMLSSIPLHNEVSFFPIIVKT